jgi:hypothetical protein
MYFKRVHFVGLHYMIIWLDLNVTKDNLKYLTKQLVNKLERKAVRVKGTPDHKVNVWAEGK